MKTKMVNKYSMCWFREIEELVSGVGRVRVDLYDPIPRDFHLVVKGTFLEKSSYALLRLLFVFVAETAYFTPAVSPHCLFFFVLHLGIESAQFYLDTWVPS